MVLFGATGDLAHRKVLPALYQLWRTDLLPRDFMVLGVARRPYTRETFRDEVRASLTVHSRTPVDETILAGFPVELHRPVNVRPEWYS